VTTGPGAPDAAAPGADEPGEAATTETVATVEVTEAAGAPNVGLSATSVLHAAMLSDWHVGSGGGTPGYVDAHVRRDGDGLPYLPGSTVTGVLRDACQTVAEALDEGRPDGAWQRWHRFLFGDQPTAGAPTGGRRIQPARVGISPARLPAALRRHLRADPALAAAATFVKPGVAIDPDTGRAADGMLRFTEMARAGLPLEAAVTLDLPPDPAGRLAVSALLVLGAAWCDRVGGDRRRGAGAVEFRFDTQEPARWAGWLADSGWTPPPPSGLAMPAALAPAQTGDQPSPTIDITRTGDGPNVAAAGPHVDASGTAAPRWDRLDLTITTRLPLRVPAETTGNVVRGLDFLPGALLLPWLSDRWGAGLVRDAVGSGGLVVRNAYPELSGQRCVPAPLTLFAVRGATTVVNTAVGGLPAVPARQVRDRWTLPHPVPAPLPAAPAPSPALSAAGRQAYGVLLRAPELELISHNQVNRTTQRPDSSTGLFTVEAIPSGRTLRSTVLLSPTTIAALHDAWGAQWAARLAGPARLGTRRRGEYGAVEVTATPAIPPDAPPAPAAGDVLRVWAVADVVVRSASLRLSADPRDVVTALTAALDGGGLRLELAAPPATRGHRSDRWQSSWQLPRESVVGLAAGSVVTVRVAAGSVDPTRLADLATAGLGERRAEGYGELLLDAELLGVAEAVAVPVAGNDIAIGGVPAPRAPAEEEELAGGVHEAELPDTSVEALAVLRRQAAVAAARHRIGAGYLAAAPAGSVPWRLARALLELSPSQRGRWRTLTADASLRATPTTLDAEVDRWRTHQGASRRNQHAVAVAIGEFLSAPDALTDLLDDQAAGANSAARLDVLAMLVDELVDSARRGRPSPGSGHDEPTEETA